MRATKLPLEVAANHLQAGWTKERVIAVLCARIERDARYLAYRQRSGRRTIYDDMTEQDLDALA
jgi:hypothetical protein